jgi:hypothetical protein
MTLSYLRRSLVVSHLLLVLVRAELNVSGEAITTRFWDCCKPSCSWENKADVSHPVQDCNANDAFSPNSNVGTGCNAAGGAAYTCNNQVPWAVNDTLSYGFAGVFITGGEIERTWCCACYQLEFTNGPVKGKTMIVQASNSAFDVKSNRFSLAIPGGNTTEHDGCARQYGVDQKVFGENHSGVGSSEDCDRLPEALRDSCKWRFDWFQDAQYPSANFKRINCPAELTEKSNCVRNDESQLAAVIEGKPSASAVVTATPLLASLTMIIAILLSA